jgi:hypothetical protein
MSVWLKFREAMYPTITDEMSAKKAASYGYLAAALSSGINLVAVLAGWLSQSALFDVLIMSIIGFFIYKMSRVAAVAGLLYSFFNVFVSLTMMEERNIALLLFFILYFLSAVRGTFAYRNYLNEH